MTNKAIFITATGTDVGKTYVSGLLVKKLKQEGINVGYYKPALSGAIRQPDGTLLPGDCEHVIKTAKLDTAPADCVTYCFEEAVSPHLAAQRTGTEINKKVILEEYKKRTEKYDFTVVEGAGGVTCPFLIKEGETVLLTDIIKSLDLPVIIVADGGLGTINSVILTVEYAKNHGLNIKGLILNNYDENNFMHRDNKIQVENLTGVKVLATVSKNDTDLNINTDNII